MKKLLILVVAMSLALLVSTAACAEKMAVSLGFDFGGTHKQNSTNQYTNAGLSAGFEYQIAKLAENFDLGVGAEYQFARTNYSASAGTFGFIPVYAVGTYQIKDSGSGLFVPFVTVRLGYNFLTGDSKYKTDMGDLSGGIYYSVGAGVSLANLASAKLLYDINNGNSGNITYSKIRLICSYNF